jgi:hypothetical protein
MYQDDRPVPVSDLRCQAQLMLDNGELPGLDGAIDAINAMDTMDALAAARREVTLAVTETRRAKGIHIVRKTDDWLKGRHAQP